MISTFLAYLSMLKNISPTSNASDTILWKIVFPSNPILQTSLYALFTKSIRANGEGMEVISFRADAPSGSSIVPNAVEVKGKAGLSFQS